MRSRTPRGIGAGRRRSTRETSPDRRCKSRNRRGRGCRQQGPLLIGRIVRPRPQWVNRIQSSTGIKTSAICASCSHTNSRGPATALSLTAQRYISSCSPSSRTQRSARTAINPTSPATTIISISSPSPSPSPPAATSPTPSMPRRPSGRDAGNTKTAQGQCAAVNVAIQIQAIRVRSTAESWAPRPHRPAQRNPPQRHQQHQPTIMPDVLFGVLDKSCPPAAFPPRPQPGWHGTRARDSRREITPQTAAPAADWPAPKKPTYVNNPSR